MGLGIANLAGTMGRHNDGLPGWRPRAAIADVGGCLHSVRWLNEVDGYRRKIARCAGGVRRGGLVVLQRFSIVCSAGLPARRT